MSSRSVVRLDWEDFRMHMPYGCDYDPSSQRLQFFNRDYTYVGCRSGFWRRPPDACIGADKKVRREYFYDDTTKPLQSMANLNAYKRNLAKFDEWTEFPNDDGYAANDTAFYLERLSHFRLVPAKSKVIL